MVATKSETWFGFTSGLNWQAIVLGRTDLGPNVQFDESSIV